MGRIRVPQSVQRLEVPAPPPRITPSFKPWTVDDTTPDLERDPVATTLMSSPSSSTLQQLHHLDKSSPNFQDLLCNVFYGEGYRQSVPNLQGDDPMWLVDYLDKVRRQIAFLHPPLNPTQALDGLDPSSAAFRKCLRELRSICGTRGILPASYMLSSDLLDVAPDPFASGGYGDVHKGTLDGSKVCIKRVRVYARDGPQKTARVCHWRRSLSRPSLTKLADILPRGRRVETLDTPKHSTAAGYHHHSLPTNL